MSGITVSRRGDRIVAVKDAAVGSEHAERIMVEAAALRRINHPGVVEYVEHRAEPTVQLVTMFAGTDTWDRQPPEGQAAIRALAGVASVLADLHEAGMTHGDLSFAHIITGAGQRPVLCGLGSSAPLSPDSELADLGALATLLDSLTESSDDTQRAQVAAISADLRRSSISARQATSRLDALLSRTTPASSSRRVNRRVVALAAALSIAVLAISVLAASDGAQTPSGASDARAVTTTTISTSPTTSNPDPETETLLMPPAAGAPTLVNKGRRYALGQPGDVTIVGDWDCDGSETPALLRPATGEVAVFNDWPAQKAGIAAEHIVIVEGAESLEVDDPDGCATLRVHTPNGSILIPLEST